MKINTKIYGVGLQKRQFVKSVAIGALGSSLSLPEKWGKPIVQSVVLPVHAETTNGDCENVVLVFTSNDLSQISYDLFEVTENSPSATISSASQGDLSGSGTQTVYSQCGNPDACYELRINLGSGTVNFSVGVDNIMRSFAGFDFLTLGFCA